MGLNENVICNCKELGSLLVDPRLTQAWIRVEEKLAEGDHFFIHLNWHCHHYYHLNEYRHHHYIKMIIGGGEVAFITPKHHHHNSNFRPSNHDMTKENLVFSGGEVAFITPNYHHHI